MGERLGKAEICVFRNYEPDGLWWRAVAGNAAAEAALGEIISDAPKERTAVGAAETAFREIDRELERRRAVWESGPEPLADFLKSAVLELRVFDPDPPTTERWTGYAAAVNVALEKHAGVFDRGGKPYWLHPARVSLRLSDPDDKAAAWLHDVVEDTDAGLDDFRWLGISTVVVRAVDAVTRRSGESYSEFIERCASDVSGRRVKTADLEDNMDVRRLPAMRDRDFRRLNKYLHAWRYLRGLEESAELIKVYE